MKSNQLTQGHDRRVMYLENKDGLIEGAQARIGWVTFSKSGRTVYYAGPLLKAIGGRGVRGKFWVSGIKKRGSNTHAIESTSVIVDDDARDEYQRLRQGD
jgi:hypothetical protein